MSNSLYIELLRDSEELCEKYQLADFKTFDTSSNENDHAYNRHDEFIRYDDEGFDKAFKDLEVRSVVDDMMNAAYFEGVMTNRETREGFFYSFSYHENDTEVSAIYQRKLHYKPQAKQNEVYGELTASFITVEEFNKFFENATLKKIKNFKSQLKLTPIFYDLLKASEEYCEKNNLSTIKDFNAVLRERQEAHELTDDIRKKLIEVLKNAAFYEERYDDDYEDVQHYAFMFDKHCKPSVKVISVLEHEDDDLRLDNYDIFDLSAIMSSETFGVEQMKCFKIFRDIK